VTDTPDPDERASGLRPPTPAPVPVTVRPAPPIALGGGVVSARLQASGDGASTAPAPGTATSLGAAVLERLRSACPVDTSLAERAEASRDWWPLALTWALDDQVPAIAAAVARPTDAAQVAEVLRICDDARVPVTAAGGRSGVEGGSVPIFGGVLLDLRGLAGIVGVDDRSLVLDVRAGTFGDDLEQELRASHGLTLGHWPQSVAMSTVGGWLACRGAGQLSNRYGKVEDMVLGLDVVLADGTRLHTGGHARQAVGPDLTQLFVGSEGTLGVITGARFRLHPAPVAEARAAYGFASFADGVDACRRILRRGATPAVLRLYDDVEADRSWGTGPRHVLLVLDEGDPILVDATMRIVAEECAAAEALDVDLVGRWLEHRNDVSLLGALVADGYVVDTMELTGSWADLDVLHERVVEAIAAIPGVVVASGHLSHSYTTGACLYVTFGGRPGDDPTTEAKQDLYVRCWDAGTRTALATGASLSHHHGVGLNRGRFVADALGPAGAGILAKMKAVLDPNGILNPGKLGLPSPFGEPPAPFAAPPGSQP
jgi:alkyldihydroxyacetonephosphate synthase